MNNYEVILIALALAIDAFAVAIAVGAYFGKTNLHQKFRLSFHFGLFQFLMPLIGWIAGSSIVKYIESYDHWLAFIVLSGIGIRMIYIAWMGEEERIEKDMTKGMSLITLSVATSIDALAVGFSIGIINSAIIFPSIIIGIVASAMTLIGIKLGEILSLRFGEKISIVGGVVLILIGLNILAQHLNIYELIN
ncbi:MAG: manganese efflux pump MntP family protein [Candidatus Kapabacteria bacterium]|nr:manganese efflux pump MntP family protein [Candidatus Kapabacteria bacterium]